MALKFYALEETLMIFGDSCIALENVQVTECAFYLVYASGRT